MAELLLAVYHANLLDPGRRLRLGVRLEHMPLDDVQYVSDENGEQLAVIVPIQLWREIESERETAYLLKSPVMKRRLLEAMDRSNGLSFEVALEKLGI